MPAVFGVVGSALQSLDGNQKSDPVEELKCFSRVQLDAGAAARVEFVIPVDMLNFTGSSGLRIVELGEFQLMVGASSGDIRMQTTVEVVGDVRTLECNWRMESHSVVTPL